MLTKEYLKKTIEQAEYNLSKNHVDYTIDDINGLSEQGAYLVLASNKDYNVTTSFVAYEDGTCFFLSDWQSSYPTNEEEIADYNNWVTIDWERLPLIFNGLPRILI